MKHFALVATLCCAVAFALVIKDIDVLIERAEKQLADAHKLVADHKNNNRGHLLAAVERNIKDLEFFLHKMKSMEKNATVRTHEINILEEDLLRTENRLLEEFEFVEDVYRNHNATNKTANELIEYGEKLVAEAKAEIDKHPKSNLLLIRSLEAEERDIERYIASIKAHPPTPGKYDYYEIFLVRHERTLRALIERLQVQQ